MKLHKHGTSIAPTVPMFNIKTPGKYQFSWGLRPNLVVRSNPFELNSKESTPPVGQYSRTVVALGFLVQSGLKFHFPPPPTKRQKDSPVSVGTA